MKYIVIADTENDNIPLGIMFVDTPDINETIKEVFRNEPDCTFIRYEAIDSGPNLPNGTMVKWEEMECEQRPATIAGEMPR